MNWKYSVAAFAAILTWPTLSSAAPVTYSASGASAANIQATVDQFRTDVSAGGALNAPGTGPFTTGRREINWDGVPDSFSDPNPFPGNFFNSNSQRGVVVSTPGTSLLVGADSSNPTSTPVRFGSINPNYITNFQTFSPERLFTAIGSTVVDVSFFEPASPATPATTNGFGAVFTDVEIADSTKIQFFDPQGQSLGIFSAPVGPNGGLSFLGVVFNGHEQVATVRITSGNTVLGGSNNDSATADVVVMDDFIYGEPFQDTDADDVRDAADQCPDSDVRLFVDVNSGDPGFTSIENTADANGCTIQDLVEDCIVSAATHGQYVSCISSLANGLKAAGTITRNQAKEMIRGAAQSTILKVRKPIQRRRGP
jgi:hypothetical protein